MLQSSIERLIQQKTGIEPTIVGANLIQNAVHRCMKLQQIADLAEYWRQLQQQPSALQQLIETVIIPETWFFRDRGPFDFLAKQFYQLRNATELPSNQPLRILSLPCSTGEEPYSIAMALLRTGIAPTAFQIDAYDISNQNIQQAIAGIYGHFSFRNPDDAIMQAQFFQAIGTSHQIHNRVKQCVQFQVGNILQFNLPAASYDVIFCRNLLIYFNPITRQTVIDRLYQLLKPNGILFVGHAETSLFMTDRWQALRLPFTFAYRKTQGTTDRPKPIPTVSPIRSLRPPSTPTNQSIIRLASIPTTDLVTTPTTKPTLFEQAVHSTDESIAHSIANSPSDLTAARQAADRADFPTAKQLCAESLQRSALQPAVYVLLGQIHQAQDQLSMATTCFSKALYLDPNDLDALIHLARLKQSDGDQPTAARLYQRIARIQAQDPSSLKP